MGSLINAILHNKWRIVLTGLACYAIWQTSSQELTYDSPTEITKVIILRQEMTDWDIFTLALIEHESINNPNAVGKTDDVGILQITPIYVKDVNRILGYNKFKMADRFDIRKSLEMFDIKNDHYNPNRDIDKAIKLHNPLAGPHYKKAIQKKMSEIRQRENIINQYLNFTIE